jgi:hypothetical protein
MAGREGEKGEGGNMTGSAYLMTTAEDGKGSHGGADDEGESSYDGRNIVRGPSFGGMGHRTLIVAPHTAATIINDDDNNNNCHHGGGPRAPSGLSRPAGRRSLLSMSPTAVDGGSTRALGEW